MRKFEREGEMEQEEREREREGERELESQREKRRWRENQAIHPCLWRRTQSEFGITHSKRQLHFVP